MRETTNRIGRLAFIGFGEAATAFAGSWGPARPTRITAFDIRTDLEMTARIDAHQVIGCTTLGAALRNVEAVFSVVTADQALAAATSAADDIAPGTLYFDCNSCAPETKRTAAERIESAGARYVDVAVMAPVHPKRHHVPLLVSGPHAEAAAAVLASLDMRPTVAGAEVGQASSVKMIRSVMIKGLEALSAECFLAARRAGVEERVIASLTASNPELNWQQRAAYNLERMMAHGVRRGAEMREVAATVEALGFSAGMSAATAAWQDQIGTLQLDPGADDLMERIDKVLSRL